MKGRWKRPISGMKWYKTAKKDFAALPDDVHGELILAPPAARLRHLTSSTPSGDATSLGADQSVDGSSHCSLRVRRSALPDGRRGISSTNCTWRTRL